MASAAPVPSPAAVASPAAKEASRNPFHAAAFGRWWLGSVVAGTGVGIQAVTVPLFVRDRVSLDSRSIAIAAALIAQTLPGALLALVGGTIADRVERRRILVRTYAVAAAISTCYVLLCVADVRRIWPVFPLAAIVGAAGAFTNPARQSLLPHIVSGAQLQNGVILGTMAFLATMQFLGPTLGGYLADLAGLTVAFAAEVALLALAAATFSGVRAEVPPRAGGSVLGDLVEGLRYVRAEPHIRGLLLLGAVPGVLFVGPFSVTVALIAPDVLHASDRWVGILWGCFGAGVTLGSLLLTWRPLPRRGLAVCLSNLCGGLVLVAYGSSDTRALCVITLVAWGLTAAVFINYVVTLLQQHAERRMLGRVMSMYSLVFFVSMPIGYAQAGVLARAFGPQATLVGNGVVAAVVGLLSTWLLRSVRRLE